MIGDFEFGEFQTVGRADDDDFFVLVDGAFGAKLEKRSECDARVRAGVKSDLVAAFRCVCEFVFRDFDNDAVIIFDRAFGLRIADRISDLDCARESLFRLDGNELVESALVSLVERICVCCLCNDDAGLLVDQTHGEAVVKSFGESAHVSEISPRNDDRVRNFPTELLADFGTDRFLTFDAEAVHRVRKVNAIVGGHLLDDFHAAVKIRVECENDASVRNRLNELRNACLSAGKKNDARNSGLGGECGKRSGRVPGRGAGDSVDRLSFADHGIHLAYENGHAEIFKAPRVRVSAELDPKRLEPDFLCESACVEQRTPAFAQCHDIFFRDFGQDHFALAPDAAHVRGLKALPAFGKKAFPFVGRTFGERFAVVVDFEKVAVHLAAVNDLVKRVGVVSVDILEIRVKGFHDKCLERNGLKSLNALNLEISGGKTLYIWGEVSFFRSFREESLPSLFARRLAAATSRIVHF